MMNRKQWTAIWAAGALALAMCITVGAESRTQIDSVSLDIESEIGAGDSSSDVDVTTDTSGCSVEEVVVTNEPRDEWDDNDRPKLKITLEAETDYYFPSGFSRDDVDLSGADARVTSVTRKSSTLFVYITLDSLDGESSDNDLDVYDLEWDESSGRASWEEGQDARKYEVRLYREDRSVTSIITTSDTSYDFSGYITKSGDYMFKVRGVYNSSEKGGWIESDIWSVSSEEANEISAGKGIKDPGLQGEDYSGAWLKDKVGWWYCNADKSYTRNNWQNINGRWYFFNETGYMVTGWVFWNNKWYYCGEDGSMYYSTTTPDGYYVGVDGAWVE